MKFDVNFIGNSSYLTQDSSDVLSRLNIYDPNVVIINLKTIKYPIELFHPSSCHL